MENNTRESQVVTFEDLAKYTKEVVAPLIDENMARFAEENLLPAIQQMFDDFRVEVDGKFVKVDEKFAKVDEKLDLINQELVNIHCEISDISSKIIAIKRELNSIEIRLGRLEIMVKEDSSMYISDIEELKKATKEVTNRLIILENKRA